MLLGPLRPGTVAMGGLRPQPHCEAICLRSSAPGEPPRCCVGVEVFWFLLLYDRGRLCHDDRRPVLRSRQAATTEARRASDPIIPPMITGARPEVGELLPTMKARMSCCRLSVLSHWHSSTGKGTGLEKEGSDLMTHLLKNRIIFIGQRITEQAQN
eukprot:scaffold199277_cov37-Prasinocladus_malaysianus.AAC.1